MATAPKKLRVIHRTLGEMLIEAERHTKTGSGVYLYDKDGNEVASFGDGEVTAVLPADVKGSNEGTA